MQKTYKCPYDDFRGTKQELAVHIEENYPEMIPKGYTAARFVFKLINKKDHGTCVVCKRETEWNENSQKYNRLCGRKECREKLRETYKNNMIKARGTYNILNDPEQQEKMLKNRSISGKYKFTDGGYHIYTGSYEKKTLEFIDKVLGFKSDDILSPGPTIEYEYKGEKHTWITDIMIIPFNLIIEVKDGGSNPNKREMKSYREKQIEKEKFITNLGSYNYLRLTNNNFEQLLDIIAELKSQMIDDTEENKKVIINIHEEVNAIEETKISMSIKSPKELNSMLNKFEYGMLDKDFKKTTNPKEYRTLSPENFYKYKTGICWDFANFEAYCFNKYLGFKATKSKLINNTYSLYFIQEKENGYQTHTWLAYMENNMVYIIESSWGSKIGIHSYKDEEEMIDDYVSSHAKNNDYILIKYSKSSKYEMTSDEYLDSIYNQKILHNDFDKSINEADIVKIPKVKGIKYIKSGDGIYNPYVMHNGEKYRPRVETLIFNDKGQIFLNNNGVPNKYGTTYILTGGGMDKGKKLEDQAAAECKEEARIIIKNITYTGITYISPYHGMYPSWQKEKLWPYGLKYEGAITYVFVAEYDKKYNGYVAPVDSVDNMWTVGKWYDANELPLRKEHKQAIKFYNKNIDIIRENYVNESDNKYYKNYEISLVDAPNEILYKLDNIYYKLRNIFESTGLASIGGVVGTMQPFITQYGPPSTFTSDDREVEGYALSNDISTKNILVVDTDGKIKKKDSSFLDGRKVKVFKYKYKDQDGFNEILSMIGKYAYREVFYEMITGKKLLSDDQILCDECFEEISPIDIYEEKASIIQTLIDESKYINGEEVIKLPLMNSKDIELSEDLIDNNKNIEIFENENGYFAENVLTHKRTGYYNSISKIKIKPIL